MSFPHLFSKKLVNIACFYDLLAKNYFWPIILCTFKIFPNFHVPANIMTSYEDGWYLFWYQWKEEPHSYTLVANTRVFCNENLEEGVATTPLGRPC